jgi:hypothetical protein
MDEKEQERAWSSSESDGQPPFHLDESVPARHVSFQTLRNLLVQIGRNQPVTYADVVDHPSAVFAAILVTAGGKMMGRSTRYHHLNALKILGLANQVHRQYRLSPRGEAIARLHTGDSAPLSAEILGLFRQAVRSCDLVQRNFLVLFTGRSDLDPWLSGAPVSLNPIPGQRSCELNCSMWPGRLWLSKTQTEGIIWGLRQWCLSVELVDEIFIRPQADVDTNRANIIFPVDPSRGALPVKKFDLVLRRYLPLGQPIYGDTVAISIPLLFYRLCPAERLALHSAKHLLKQWLAEHTDHAFVEAASYSILESGRLRRGASRVVWSKQREAFLEIENKLYSRLLVSESVWTTEGALSHAH